MITAQADYYGKPSSFLAPLQINPLRFAVVELRCRSTAACLVRAFLYIVQVYKVCTSARQQRLNIERSLVGSLVPVHSCVEQVQTRISGDCARCT